MPRHTTTSTQGLAQHICTDMHAGTPQKQAVAIAYAVQRRAQSTKNRS
jgi:hypothetical protein